MAIDAVGIADQDIPDGEFEEDPGDLADGGVGEGNLGLEDLQDTEDGDHSRRSWVMLGVDRGDRREQ